MALQLRKYSNLKLVELILQGGIIGGADIVREASKTATLVGSSPQVTAQSGLFLHGKTLVFNAPSATVTFAATPANVQVPMTLPTAIAQIHTQTSNAVKVQLIDGKLAIVDSDASAAVDLDETGTANSIFGFDSTGDTVGTLYNAPGGGAPELVEVMNTLNENTYLVVTNEA